MFDIVMVDMSPIVRADGSYLYLALDALYTSINGESTNAFYRSTLMALTGTLDFSDYPNLGRLAVSTNKSILYYLHNVTGLILDGCSLLTDTFNNAGVTIDQMDFSKMAALQTLSIQGCTGLSNDIDLTDNEDIREVDASGTTVNVILPANPKVTKLELGTPTAIDIDSPTALTSSGIAVDSAASLTSLDIVNPPVANNGSDGGFHMFGKIMGVN